MSKSKDSGDDNESEDGEQEDKPEQPITTVQIGKFSGVHEIKLQVKTDDSMAGPQVSVDCSLGSLIALLTPLQAHILYDLINEIVDPSENTRWSRGIFIAVYLIFIYLFIVLDIFILVNVPSTEDLAVKNQWTLTILNVLKGNFKSGPNQKILGSLASHNIKDGLLLVMVNISRISLFIDLHIRTYISILI